MKPDSKLQNEGPTRTNSRVSGPSAGGRGCFAGADEEDARLTIERVAVISCQHPPSWKSMPRYAGPAEVAETARRGP